MSAVIMNIYTAQLRAMLVCLYVVMHECNIHTSLLGPTHQALYVATNIAFVVVEKNTGQYCFI